MPLDAEKLSDATDAMGMARGEGVMRGKGRRETPRGVCQSRTDTGTCAVGHVAHGRRHLELLERVQEVGDWILQPPLLAMFLEVVARRQQPYQCFGRLKQQQQLQPSNPRTLVGHLPLTVLKWRRRLLGRNNTDRNYFLLQSSTSAEVAR